MSMRAHICKTYKVEYADKIINTFNDMLIHMAYHSDACYISEDETIIEIPFDEIRQEIQTTNDKEWKYYLEYVLLQADSDNDYVRFEIF